MEQRLRGVLQAAAMTPEVCNPRPRPGFWERVLRRVVAVWRQRRLRQTRRLRLCETLALGERRLLAVAEFEGQRFLIAATPSSVVLLSRLPGIRKDNVAEKLAADDEPAA